MNEVLKDYQIQCLKNELNRCYSIFGIMFLSMSFLVFILFIAVWV
jgi:hypothetical protein